MGRQAGYERMRMGEEKQDLVYGAASKWARKTDVRLHANQLGLVCTRETDSWGSRVTGHFCIGARQGGRSSMLQRALHEGHVGLFGPLAQGVA